MPKIKEVVPSLFKELMTSKTMLTALGSIGIEQATVTDQFFDPSQPVTMWGLGVIVIRVMLAYFASRQK